MGGAGNRLATKVVRRVFWADLPTNLNKIAGAGTPASLEYHWEMYRTSQKLVTYVRLARYPPPLDFQKANSRWGAIFRPGDTREYLGPNCALIAEERMRISVRSAVLSLIAVAWLLPAIAMGAESNTATATASASTTAAATATPNNSGPSLGTGTAINPTLVELLVKKGIITSSEADSLKTLPGSTGMEQLLLLLKTKGVVSDSEVSELKAATEGENHAVIDAESGPMASASLVAGSPQAKVPEKTSGPTVVPAIAPVRVLPLNPTKEGLGPSLKLGSGVEISPYGFIKATEAYDSLDPTGDDFPRPGFTAADTGPNKNPEWHMKARSTRFGSKFEFPDVSKNIIVTGQVEADFEGNFSRADNRNVSAIRSNALQLRLAFGRIDWSVNPNSDIFFEAGQDWTIFGSSAMMNLLETTFYGAYWGNLYERSPQMRVGLVQKLGGSRNWKFSPEF